MDQIKRSHDINEVLSSWVRYINPTMRAGFLGAFFVGLLVHMAGIWGWIFNWDTTIGERRDGPSWILSQGKWFLDPLSKLTGQYDTPFRGIIGLVVIAVVAMLLIDLFQIQGSVWGATLGAVLAGYPATMSITAYRVYTYYWVMLMAVLSVWFTQKIKGWKGWVSGTGLLILALGAYPPYIGFAASTLLIVLIRELVFENKSCQKTVIHSIQALIQLLVSVLGYYGILQTFLRWNHQQLSSYMNVDAMESINWQAVPSLIKYAYSDIFQCFWYDVYGTGYPELIVFYRLLVAALVFGVVWLPLRKRLWRTPMKLAAYLLFAGVFPLAVNLTDVLNQGAGMHWMMRYTFVMVPITLVVMASDIGQSVQKKEEVRRVAYLQQWVSLVVCALLVYNWGMICNEGYTRMRYSYEKAYATLVTVVDDVIESPDYTTDKPIAFIGTTDFFNTDKYTQYDNYTGIADATFIFCYEGVFERYVEMILGVSFPYASLSEKEALQKTDEFKSMPVYPTPGYVSEINEMLVVRLG